MAKKYAGISGFHPAKKGGSELHSLDLTDNTAPVERLPNSPRNIGKDAPPEARKPGESMAEWNARRGA